MATVICVTNQKGGVGKTTTVVNLGYYLAKDGFKTLIVDFDPQGNATNGLGIDEEKLEVSMAEVAVGQAKMGEVILETKYKNLKIAPTTQQLANAEVEMAKNKWLGQLKKAIGSVSAEYDYVLIDLPPSLSYLTTNGMIAAEYLLLPVQTEFYAMKGVAQLLGFMKEVKRVNPALKILGVVATMYDKRTALSPQVLTEIKKYFKTMTFETTIPRNVRLAEAPSHGVPVGDYDKFSRGAKAYKELAREVEKRTGRRK